MRLGVVVVRAVFAVVLGMTLLVGLTGTAGDAATGWTKVSAGQDHRCAIRSTMLYCWGLNDTGQVGIGGQTEAVDAPEQIGSLSEWTDVSAGGYHSCGIRATRLYCWGSDSNGQLGNGSKTGVVVSPKQISLSTGWTDVELGHVHSCAIRAARLYCWGNDSQGEVGDGAGTFQPVHVTTPVQVGSAADWSAVNAGSQHTCGIRSGALYCWGNDTYEQLGNSAAVTGNKLSPVRIGLATNWTYVDAGNNHTCGIRATRLYCWGNDQNEEIGNGASPFQPLNVGSPIQIGTALGWTFVSAEHVHTCGTRSGLLYCWGTDSDGQLGNGSQTGAVASPQQIESTTTWTDVSAGDYYTCGIRSMRLYCWGNVAGYPNVPTEVG